MAKKIGLLYFYLLFFISFLEASPMGEWIKSNDRSAFDSISTINVPVTTIIAILSGMTFFVVILLVGYKTLKLPDELLYFKKGKYSSKYSDELIEDDEYEIVVSGIFDAHQIKINLEPGIKSFPEEVWEMINVEWETAIASGYNFEDKVLYALQSFNIQQREILLTLQKTSYKAFYGTNIRHPSHPLTIGHTADVLSFCAVIETVDNKILFLKKTRYVHEYKGRWHVPGYNFEKIESDKINAFEYVLEKLHPECGIAEKEIDSIVCLGLAKTLLTKKPELIFYVKVNIHGNFLIDLAKKAVNSRHNEEFTTIPASEVHQFVTLNKFSPIGTAAIMQYLELAYERKN